MAFCFILIKAIFAAVAADLGFVKAFFADAVGAGREFRIAWTSSLVFGNGSS
jgi:hypothetical protein